MRSESKSKDGFKLWHTLCREYIPNTRQRALALSQALSAYPVFGKDKSSLESILAFEQLVLQYEEASGSTYPPTHLSSCQQPSSVAVSLSCVNNCSCPSMRRAPIRRFETRCYLLNVSPRFGPQSRSSSMCKIPQAILEELQTVLRQWKLTG